MNLSRVLGIGLTTAAAAWFASSSVACGTDSVNNKDYGQPPDAGIFNPGSSGGGDGYGSSGGVAPFVCPDELKACSHEFTYPFAGETSVELRGDFGGPDTWQAGVPMKRDGAVWKATTNVPFGKPVQFKFYVNGAEWKVDPAQPTVTDASSNTNNTFAGKTCEPAVCNEIGPLPTGVFDWRDSVMYFVFVDRVLDGNGANNCNVAGTSGPIANYQGGDWAGVRQKITEGYFNDLGVNTLWITVPFNNPDVTGQGVGGDTHQYSGYHGYWPKIDANDPASLAHEGCFGSFAELKGLVDDAHAKGIKVLIDYAMVHVHSSSALFSAHSDWFWPNNNGKGGNCICGEGCSWDAMPDRERCWFTGYLPHWNYTNPAARDYSVTNAVEWVKQTGVDGFRADAIKHVDISWLNELRSRIKTDITAKQTPPQRFYMVGETYDFGNRDVLKSYVDPSTKLDGQFDFPLRKVLVESVLMRTVKMSDLANFMNGNEYFYGANAVMSTFVGNHDLPRVIHLAANSRLWGDNQASDGKDRSWANQPTIPAEREAFERLANAFAVLMTNRGAPLIYYGDEIGLPGAGDPDNRRFMQWTGLNGNQTFLRDRMKKLGKIREAHPALRRGSRSTITADDDLWVYTRTTTGDTVYVAINRGDGDKTATGLPGGSLDELVTGTPATGPNVTIPARQARIFVAK